MEIIPAILTNDEEIFKRQIEQSVAIGAKTVQVDFTDGKFVNSKTLIPDELDSFVISKSGLILEAHLMIENPEKFFATLYALGFKRIAPHFEALLDPAKALSIAHDYGLEIGLALNPETQLEKIESFIQQINFVLFLTVVPGEQGRSFETPVLDKITDFHSQYPDIPIEVDGGIKHDNIQTVANTGADRIVVGSGIWHSGNPQTAFNQLQTAASTVI